MKFDLPIVSFETADEWREWLLQHYTQETGVWLWFFKKASGKKTVTYDEALDEALCFGWIDGLVKTYDSESYVQRFTPRRKRSVWSKRNTEHIARLTRLGKMHEAGIAQVTAAQKDGRWERATHPPSEMTAPPEWTHALSQNKKAREFFETLNRANKFAIFYQLSTAKKQETKINRLKKFVGMMERGEKLY
jgi:uncharacterized protein YdeI (YjbR/CyaY-like superfamily)